MGRQFGVLTMAQSSDGGTDLDDLPVASDEQYKEETRSTKWVPLHDAKAKVKVVTAPPMKFLQKLEQYSLEEFVKQDMDVEDLDEEQALETAGDLSGFMQDVVVDRVINPYGYWGDKSRIPDELPEGTENVLDCSELSDNDTQALITGIMGQDGGDPDGFDPDRFQE